ncbi:MULTISPECIES: transcriptional activator NhaR [unclassified Oceanobacter]|jgi:LysR family transcriptional activator of nhaA|uniref:transcriptional activator NhaR n=2 Tax=Gammaproteobacteria TaxID=1236 RepID=UPI0026E2CC0C|nr:MULTISPECIES: transcriptional activator NhaR [unclassified Oceanobacter]MDO6683543.1 transcriptional activator NhaR [Oceanobacter sp. 5_MG-2023]MDP2504778.1 transcriptional activator NhaR [Oceanobacter sp. 3_MG-2023]MDP2546221.1 transcriptional activator NhaR [Oceanobacter sp. 4_MG-2023]MDP2607523.1 transcriptional activator NhaR [Oceanobacter sp. 1_MG-2023]MDP2610791.1 transcriptional activator NhaR [Oceanobacter sp. 2_MG-2023]
MHRINYKHLQYFHSVATEGSIQLAAIRLSVTPQTISGQLKILEDDLGVALFAKSGRGLELTDAGRVALDYSRQIFQLGDELQEVMNLGITERPSEFRVGIVDALPKSIAHRLLSPAMLLPGTMRIVCHEEQMSSLLGELAVHRLDLILADSPIPPGMNIRCFNHLLGRSRLACFATPELVQQQQGKRTFPDMLNEAPVLLPTDTASGLRTDLLSWFNHTGIAVRIAGEFDDSALLKAFGSQGHGYFFAPDVIREEICAKYQVRCVGTVKELMQEFYAISAERRISHQAVAAITRQTPLGEIG